MTPFTKDKNDYQRVNIDAIKRVVDAEVTKKPIPKKDAAGQGDVGEAARRFRQARQDPSRRPHGAQSLQKGLAELSLSRPNGPTPDVTKFDGNLA